ncbi:MAG: terminase large subunit, partial [Treponema sp.]|nr:terminase large subunit [Treponema sp.]
AVMRHVSDLKRVGKKDFPYRFDASAAKRAIDFIHLLEHTKGEFANRALHPDIKLKLQPWQQFLIWQMEGWRNKDGFRRFTRAYIEVARKNGKSSLAAALANYHFFADSPREVGPEIYFAATKQQQAAITWEEAERQIRRNATLKELAQTYKTKKHIVVPKTAAIMRPLGRDSKTEDGLNPSFAVIDEYHAHPDAGLIDVIESGMGARKQPLIVIITTAGTNYIGPCFEEHEHLKKMLEGSIPPVDNYFGIIYTLDENDDWKNPKVWVKANPNLGVSVDEARLTEQINLAASSTTKIMNVKTKRLNIWCKNVMGWISFADWEKCGKQKYTESELSGRPCYGGMDLSSTQDISALSLSFPPQNEREPYKHIYRFYIPEELIQEKEDIDKVPYRAWIDEGFIIATPGNVIDYDWIEQDILNMAATYEIREFCFDPFHAQEIVNHLTTAGINMLPIQQGYRMMSPMCDSFEKRVLSQEMAHGNNPVMRWMMSCIEMKSDRQGNVMPMKPRRGSTGKRIDGVVANIMSLGRASLQMSAAKSVYEDRGVLSV